MKLIKYFCILIISVIIIWSCDDDYEVIEGQFPEIAVNFEDINSEYDDYNSAVPADIYYEFSFLFSSNRNSIGAEFDIMNFIITLLYNDNEEVKLFVNESGSNYFEDLVSSVNTQDNEYGPYIMRTKDNMNDLFLYASDSSGNLDIYYAVRDVLMYNWEKTKSLSKINTENNEAYFTINRNQDAIYFCSDVNEDYDIFKVDLSGSGSFMDWLDTEEIPVWDPCVELNSDSDDKCPYINGSIMVFASDREGGYGGYDLYYSEQIDGEWSEPVNFGENVNSEYDEFRPITLYFYEFKNDLMFFSSNRPGGKGGFDLYYVGISKLKP